MNNQNDDFALEHPCDPALILAQFQAEHEDSLIVSVHRGAFSSIVVFMLSLRDLSLPNWSEAHATWERLNALYRVLEQYMEARAHNLSSLDEPPFHEVEHTKEDFLLFLEALERLERVALESEAYRNRPPSPPPCTVL